MVVTVVRAYVLIQAEVGLSARVATEVGGIHGVSSSDTVTGPYDVNAEDTPSWPDFAAP